MNVVYGIEFQPSLRDLGRFDVQPSVEFLFSVGGAGDPPASLDDSPSATGDGVRLERSVHSFPLNGYSVETLGYSRLSLRDRDGKRRFSNVDRAFGLRRAATRNLNHG